MTQFGDRPSRAPAGHAEASGDDAARWAALARRIAAGDSDAEAELADLFFPRARLFASVRLHGSQTASDIAQETIIAVIEALRAGRLHEPFNLPGFVLGAARNLVSNHHRKSARNLEVQVDLPDHPADADPYQIGLDAERRALVREAMSRLNALDRRILLLTLVDGMKPREIAPIVGLKAEAVRTRKARAVKEVAEAVERTTRTHPPDHEGTRFSEP